MLPGSWSLELPVIETVEEHLGQVVHHLPLLGGKVVEFVQDKVGDALSDTRFLIRRISQWALHGRFSPLNERD